MNLKMWTNDCDYVIATTVEEAKQICIDTCGYGRDEVDEWDWEEVPRDQDFTFDDGDQHIKETIGHFILEYGRGYFACSEYQVLRACEQCQKYNQ